MPACLQVEAEDADEIVMAVKHQKFLCYGLQFHPESILTTQGEILLRNFLQEAGIC
jgi:anthranilate synthase component 2